eukprot:TRINITY_DN13553_c0_g1_i1.p1 TRINITY_DN13553_c0_g1~~TRINITY_DN13553_c0_g1_i1.p1  ORF type:complete len:761 (-),score=210.73 TRINITY_DN13553_c0_g1_i1:24-2306(-)
MADGQKKVKILLVGENAVGKTELMHALCNLPFTQEYHETIRMETRDVTLQDIVARFWDVSPNYMDAIRGTFWDDVLCVLLIYDVGSQASFEAATQRYYREAASSSARVIMLIGCKCDRQDRQVTITDAETFATRNSIFFMEVSALEKTNLDLTLKIIRIRVSHALRQPQPQPAAPIQPPTPAAVVQQPVSQYQPQIQQQYQPIQPAMTQMPQYQPQLQQQQYQPIQPIQPSWQAMQQAPQFQQPQIQQFQQPVQPLQFQSQAAPQFQMQSQQYQQPMQPSVHELQQQQQAVPQYLPQQYAQQQQQQQPRSQQISLQDSASPEASESFAMDNWDEPQGTDENGGVSDRYEELKKLFDQVGVQVTQSVPVGRSFPAPQGAKSALSKLKSFEQGKGGRIVPVVETALPARKPSTIKPTAKVLPPSAKAFIPKPGMREMYGREPQTEPQLYLEIKLGDGRVGQIGVREGDNAYHLAEIFAKAMKLDRQYVKKLALLIQMQVKEYNKHHSSASAEQKKRELKEARAREAEEMRKFMEQKPFSFATQQRADARRPILFKLHIDVTGRGKMGLIAVRRGDDPLSLARNFVRTFRLRTELVDEIVEKINQQTVLYYRNLRELGSSPSRQGEGVQSVSMMNAGDDDSQQYAYTYDEGEDFVPQFSEAPDMQAPPVRTFTSASSGASYSSAGQGQQLAKERVLFNLDVDIGDGRTGRIRVMDGVLATKLAINFATTHKLNEAIVPRLTRLIEQNLELYRQNQEERQRLRV